MNETIAPGSTDFDRVAASPIARAAIHAAWSRSVIQRLA
jgi:hypothetical protein